MSARDQIATAVANADYVAADHLRDYRHAQMRVDVFVLGAQIRHLCDRHRVPVSAGAGAAMNVANNLDQFWTMYDVRHRDLRGYLVELAAELRRIERIASARTAPATATASTV